MFFYSQQHDYGLSCGKHCVCLNPTVIMLAGILISTEFLSTKGRRESKSDHSFPPAFFPFFLSVENPWPPWPSTQNHSPRLGIAQDGGVWRGQIMLKKDKLGAETKASKQSERSLERGRRGGGLEAKNKAQKKDLEKDWINCLLVLFSKIS